jgi:hypothetical protein
VQPLPPAGWYPDPNGSPHQRWWNGQDWTDDLAQTAATPAAVGASTPATGYAPQSYPGYPSARPYQGAPRNGLQSSRYSLITVGVSALYVLLAATSHVVFIGVLPALMAFRSFQAKEKLAPVAAVAAVVSIIVAFTALS